MTPFARFFLVMLFLLPAAFIGASWWNDEDPVQNFKELVGWETAEPSTEVAEMDAPEPDVSSPKETSQDTPSNNTPSENRTTNAGNTSGDAQLKYMQQMVDALQKQVTELENRVEELERKSAQPPSN